MYSDKHVFGLGSDSLFVKASIIFLKPGCCPRPAGMDFSIGQADRHRSLKDFADPQILGPLLMLRTLRRNKWKHAPGSAPHHPSLLLNCTESCCSSTSSAFQLMEAPLAMIILGTE